MPRSTDVETALKVSRLKNRADFIRARGGARAHGKSFVLQLLENDGSGDLRVGFTVTKKIGNAVMRNRIKRRLREAVRLSTLPATLASHDAVLIARREALDIPFQDLICDITSAFQKALKKGGAAPKTVANDERSRQKQPQTASAKTSSETGT